MKKYIVTFALASLCCTGFIAEAIAQTTPLPAASTAQVQPEARQLIDGMLKACKELNSLSVTVKLNETNPEAKQFNFRTQVDFQKPNKVRVVNRRWRGTLTAISDGTHLFITQSTDKKRYYQDSAQDVTDVLGMVIADGPGLSDLLEAKNPLESPFLKSARVGKSTVVGGVAVDVVVIESAGAKSRTTTTLAIGRTDHLLRRNVGVSTLFGGTASSVETETDFNVKVNPVLPPSLFVFTPPPGSQEIKTGLDSWILGRS